MTRPAPDLADLAEARAASTAQTAVRMRRGCAWVSLRAFLRRRWRSAAVAMLLVAAYPVFVLATVYTTTLRSDLPGGRHGPKDAYRHSLASAVVAYTGSPAWVRWATLAMEGDGHGDAARTMDIHNNRIGARIGAEAESWDAMHRDVLAAVRAGAIDAKEDTRITWLPPERWQNRLY